MTIAPTVSGIRHDLQNMSLEQGQKPEERLPAPEISIDFQYIPLGVQHVIAESLCFLSLREEADQDIINLLLCIPKAQRNGFLSGRSDMVSKIISDAKGKLSKLPTFLKAILKEIGPTITSLTLEPGCYCHGEIEGYVHYFPRLQKLDLMDANLQDSDVVHLQKLPDLQRLILHSSTEVHQIDCRAWKNLKALDLRLTKALPVCCPDQLERLFFSRPVSPKALERLKYLQVLNGSFEGNTDDATQVLCTNHPLLERLEMFPVGQEERHTEKGIYCLAELPKLRHFSIGDAHSFSSTVCAALRRSCPKLEYFEVMHCCQFGNKGLMELAQLPLRKLELHFGTSMWDFDNGASNCIDDDGLIAFIEKRRDLQKLVLERQLKLTEKGIEAIGRLPQLQQLQLRGDISITTNAFAAIQRGCPDLQKLELREVKIDNKEQFFAILAGMQHLKTIALIQCTPIIKEDTEVLQKLLPPHIKITIR